MWALIIAGGGILVTILGPFSISGYGIDIESSSSNNLTGNNASSDSGHGIYVYDSTGNNLTRNTGASNTGVGIYFDESSSSNYLINNN